MWDMQQREYLQAMGLRVERWIGDNAASFLAVTGAAPSERLLAQLLRAARLTDAAQLPPFASAWDGAGKRAYWRLLRALRAGRR